MVIGRDDILSKIGEDLEAVLAGGKRLVLVEGDPGMGKSSLQDFWINRCKTLNCNVREVRFSEVGSSPFKAVEDLLGFEFSFQEQADSVYLQSRIGELLISETSSAPLCLFLDDFQWADQSIIPLLQCCLSLNVGPLLVYVSCRPLLESGACGETIRIVDRLKRRGGRCLTLVNLDFNATRELAERVSESRFSAEEAHRIFDETAGHPLTVEHYCRTRTETGGCVIPNAFHELLKSRFCALDALSQRVLRSLSVAPKPLKLEALSVVAGKNEISVVDSIRFLMDRNLVVERTEGFELSHSLMRRVLVDEMRLEERQAYHRALAEAAGLQDEPDVAVLAVHYEGYGDHEGAFRTYRKLGGMAPIWESATRLRFLRKAYEHLQESPLRRAKEAVGFYLHYSHYVTTASERKGLISLAEQIGITEREQFAYQVALTGLHNHNLEYGKAMRLGEKALNLAGEEQERSFAWSNIIQAKDGAGDVEGAVAAIDDFVDELRRTSSSYANHRIKFFRAYRAFLLRQYEQVLQLLERIPAFDHYFLYLRSACYAGSWDKARQSATVLARTSEGNQTVATYYLALVHADRNDALLAIEILERRSSQKDEKYDLWARALLLETKAAEGIPCSMTDMLRIANEVQGESKTVVGRALGVGFAFLGSDAEAAKSFEMAMDIEKGKRAAQWVRSGLRFLEFDLDRGNLSRARATAEEMEPEVRRMQIPRLADLYWKLAQRLRSLSESNLALGEILRIARQHNDAQTAIRDLTGRISGLLGANTVSVVETDGDRGVEFGETLDISTHGRPLSLKVCGACEDLAESDSLRFQVRAIGDILGLLQAGISSPAKLAKVDQAYGLVGSSPAVVKLRQQIQVASKCDEYVLICGETGTGKELVARAIWKNGARKDGPFVAINCAALSDELLLSELFGHVKGAFTGADKDREGVLESAQGGVLLLDEIGEASSRVQSALLRAVQESVIRRVGENRERPVDVRVISATNRDLRSEQNGFRPDLLYRLGVVQIETPPLRDRAEDILDLVAHFVGRLSDSSGRAVRGVDSAAMEVLKTLPWPGNVRELENWVRTELARMEDDGVLGKHAATGRVARQEGVPATNLKAQVESLETRMITSALQENRGNVSVAARRLGMSRSGLQKKMTKYGIQRAG